MLLYEVVEPTERILFYFVFSVGVGWGGWISNARTFKANNGECVNSIIAFFGCCSMHERKLRSGIVDMNKQFL